MRLFRMQLEIPIRVGMRIAQIATKYFRAEKREHRVVPLRIAAGMGEAEHLLMVGGLSPSRVEPVPTVEGHERIGVVEPLGRQRLEKSVGGFAGGIQSP